MTNQRNRAGAIIVEGHVQGLSNTRSLGELGIPVIVIDKNNCIARYSKYCIEYIKCPDYQSNEFVDFLIKLSVRKNLKNWVLIPSNDHIVYTISKNKGLLQDYYKIITPDINIINKIYNKSVFLQIGNKMIIPYPKTYSLDITNLSSIELQFPAIIKGKFGLDFYKKIGKKAIIVNDYNDLSNSIDLLKNKIDLKSLILQEIIPECEKNKTISFTAFAIEGKIKAFWMGIKKREHPKQFGTATFCESVYVNELISPSKKLLSEINYTGVCEIEYIFDQRDNAYKLIEMNARTWLWISLARACGIDFVQFLYNHANNIGNYYPETYRINVKWINFWTDIFYAIQHLITGSGSIKEYLNSYRGEVVHAVYSAKDPFPFIVMTILLPYLMLRR